MNLNVLLLGVDSLIACLAIGPIVSGRWRVPLALLFGLADGAGFVVGSLLGWHLPDEVTNFLPAVALLAYGLYLVVVAAGTAQVAARWPVWVLPWFLSIDNLSYGLVDQRTAGDVYQQAGVQALASGLLALLGLCVAVLVPLRHRMAPRRTAGVAGGALLLASAALVLVG